MDRHSREQADGLVVWQGTYVKKKIEAAKVVDCLETKNTSKAIDAKTLAHGFQWSAGGESMLCRPGVKPGRGRGAGPPQGYKCLVPVMRGKVAKFLLSPVTKIFPKTVGHCLFHLHHCRWMLWDREREFIHLAVIARFTSYTQPMYACITLLLRKNYWNSPYLFYSFIYLLLLVLTHDSLSFYIYALPI